MKTEEMNEAVDQILHEEETPDNASETEATKAPSRTMSPRARIISALLLLSGIGFSISWYIHVSTYETTDDAEIDGHINAVSPRIAGTVDKVYVDDNVAVQAGQPLVDLDTRELTIAEEQADAQYAQALARAGSEGSNLAITQNTTAADIILAKSQLEDARAALAASEQDRQSSASHLVEAEATDKRDELQAERYKQLFEKDETSRQVLENYSATAQASAARLAAAQASLASAEQTVQEKQAQVDSQIAHLAEVTKNAPHELAMRENEASSQKAGVELANAELDRTKLDLGFAHIVAPIAGVVTQRSVELGNHVAPGEQLLMLVDISHLWITADFKETQLRNIHPGCRAEIHVDALGRSFQGTVESMPAITGARSSVLPPENATGNYVKVVQRLPIRIELNSGQSGLNKLRPGMSVEAKVYVK
ncbi:MAG TPA: HlyD family secretion protein [Terracidiphilus sp.]|nr:HlyD family secretion protein [Terracidiphilus sp.]